MVTNLQFAAVATYLLWCLFASVSGALHADEENDDLNIDECDKNVPAA